MKFKFKLESVLKIRKHELKIEKQKLATKIRQQNELETKYENHLKNLKSAAKYKDEGDQSASQNREKMFQNYLLIETRMLNQLTERITRKKQEVNQQRKTVTEANKQVQMIEKLKNKALMEYQMEADRQEQRFQNEIATQMYHRQPKSWI